MIFYRTASEFLRPILSNASSEARVVLVSGARQVGKTTLITETLQHWAGHRPSLSLNLETDHLLLQRILRRIYAENA